MSDTDLSPSDTLGADRDEVVTDEAVLHETRFGDSASQSEDIAGLTRLGPGSMDSLRFKRTVRREANGYFVDETIGASLSAVTRGPMSRDIALDYLDARHRDASVRFEHRRDRLATTPPRLRRAAAPPPPPPPPAPVEELPQDILSETDLFVFEPAPEVTPAPIPAPEPTGLANALLASAIKPASATRERDDGRTVDLEDVMKRITRLLDER